MSEHQLHILGDIISFVSYYLEQSSCNLVIKHIIVYGDFGGRGHFKSCWLPWLPNNRMQHHNNFLLMLKIRQVNLIQI